MVLYDERMQSRDECRGIGECRNRGECKEGDAETSGKAEPKTIGRADAEEQRIETRVEHRRKGAKMQRRRNAKAQSAKAQKQKD